MKLSSYLKQLEELLVLNLRANSIKPLNEILVYIAEDKGVK